MKVNILKKNRASIIGGVSVVTAGIRAASRFWDPEVAALLVSTFGVEHGLA